MTEQPRNKNVVNQPPAYEFSSYESRVSYSHYYFGLDVFDSYTQDQLTAIVRDPIGNNELVREISRILYGTSGVYTNTVDYMVAMPTLDKVIVSYGKNTSKKQKHKELVESTLRTIKDKEFVRDALFRNCRSSRFFRKNDDRL